MRDYIHYTQMLENAVTMVQGNSDALMPVFTNRSDTDTFR